MLIAQTFQFTEDSSERRGKYMTNDGSNSIKAHPVVSHEEWLSARTAFLAKEKEFTRLRDELSRQRRELPKGETRRVWKDRRPGSGTTIDTRIEA